MVTPDEGSSDEGPRLPFRTRRTPKPKDALEDEEQETTQGPQTPNTLNDVTNKTSGRLKRRRNRDVAANEDAAREDDIDSTPTKKKRTTVINVKAESTDPDVKSLYLYNGAQDPDVQFSWFQVEERLRESQQQGATAWFTFPPVVVVAVSYNNYACSNHLGYQARWSQREAGNNKVPQWCEVYIVRKEWSTQERSDWERGTALGRQSQCSLGESPWDWSGLAVLRIPMSFERGPLTNPNPSRGNYFVKSGTDENAYLAFRDSHFILRRQPVSDGLHVLLLITPGSYKTGKRRNKKTPMEAEVPVRCRYATADRLFQVLKDIHDTKRTQQQLEPWIEVREERVNASGAVGQA
ncbi:hypothetical protein P171DRAFT_473577 [Karstenula rhodostoma CBS 690.94]|uniref:Uncharacterized protein n=1 Tax=Karstenula rhodostoma CBS 690.94 TaxID=1392251 RepID=A0A9P4PIE5_9PLEO|nr:hypothetical protein P171DRAFT_473577 [Karstenula rhodostoma CBS 690.94]